MREAINKGDVVVKTKGTRQLYYFPTAVEGARHTAAEESKWERGDATPLAQSRVRVVRLRGRGDQPVLWRQV